MVCAVTSGIGSSSPCTTMARNVEMGECGTEIEAVAQRIPHFLLRSPGDTKWREFDRARAGSWKYPETASSKRRRL